MNNSVSITAAHTTAIEIDVEMGETGGSAPDEVVDDEDEKYNYYECKSFLAVFYFEIPFDVAEERNVPFCHFSGYNNYFPQ